MIIKKTTFLILSKIALKFNCQVVKFITMFDLYTYTSISCLSNIYTKSEWKKPNKIQQCCYGYDKVFTTEPCNQQ